MIDLEKPWEPSVSHSLVVLLKLGVLGRASLDPDHINLEDNTKTQGTAASTRLGITGLAIGNVSGLDLKNLMKYSGKITVGDGKGKDNAKINHVLFGKIKTRTTGGRTVKSCNLREKIKKGELPPLTP